VNHPVYIYINKTSIKRNILTIKKIHREAGRAKDLSEYVCVKRTVWSIRNLIIDIISKFSFYVTDNVLLRNIFFWLSSTMYLILNNHFHFPSPKRSFINPAPLFLFICFVKRLLVVSCFLFDNTKHINLLVSSSTARRNLSYLASTRTKTCSVMSRRSRKSRAVDVSSENV